MLPRKTHCTNTGSTMTWPVSLALSLSLPGEEGHIRLGPLLLLSEFQGYLGWWLCGHVAEAVEVWPTEGRCNLRLPWAPFIPESVLPIPYLLDPAPLLGSLHTTVSMRPQVWVRPLLENRLQAGSPILSSHSHSECSVALDGSPVLLVKGQTMGWGSCQCLAPQPSLPIQYCKVHGFSHPVLGALPSTPCLANLSLVLWSQTKET